MGRLGDDDPRRGQNIVVAVAYAQGAIFRASFLQLVSNVGAMLLAGTITLAVQRVLYQRRYAAHLRDLARWEKELERRLPG